MFLSHLFLPGRNFILPPVYSILCQHFSIKPPLFKDLDIIVSKNLALPLGFDPEPSDSPYVPFNVPS
jgi:hypothetical protein